MKSTLSLFITLILAGFLLQSCTKVEEPYYTTKKIIVDTTNYRWVLLEDYTGMKCTNCPEAAILARELDDLYHGQIQVLAVHAGYFANPDSLNPASPYYKQDFRNATSQTWYTAFAIPTNPLGMVNRVMYRTSDHAWIQTSEWAEAVAAQTVLPKAAVMSMNNNIAVNGNDTMLSTTVQVRFLHKYQGNFNLCVCVSEDSIVGAQKWGTQDVLDYVFMDLLRGSVNGYWGEALVSNTDSSTVLSKQYSYRLKGNWVQKNLNVVAFVMNADTREVLHVIKRKAKK